MPQSNFTLDKLLIEFKTGDFSASPGFFKKEIKNEKEMELALLSCLEEIKKTDDAETLAKLKEYMNYIMNWPHIPYHG